MEKPSQVHMHLFLSVLDYACDMISCLKFLSPSDIPTQPGEQKNFQKGLISGNSAAGTMADPGSHGRARYHVCAAGPPALGLPG